MGHFAGAGRGVRCQYNPHLSVYGHNLVTVYCKPAHVFMITPHHLREENDSNDSTGLK